MSVNGSGKDRRTSKPLSDSTSWSVKAPDGTVLTVYDRKEKKDKDLTGLNAADAFAAVRNFRFQGITAAAVRT
jgi:hypothetical protein